MKFPKVSIIVPVYNVEKYLARCLDSLINQTLKDIEIICVNDGSTDNSAEILNLYKQKDDRIIVINQGNRGVSFARNTAINAVHGEFTGFVDSDDWIDPDFYEKLYYSAIKNNCEIAAASVLRESLHKRKNRILYTEEKISEKLEDKIEICDIPNCCYIWNKVYKTKLLENTKFKEGAVFEDVLWLPEIIKKSGRLITVPKTKYHYIVNPKSIVNTRHSSKMAEDSYRAKKYIVDFFDENNLKLSLKERNVTKKVIHFLNIPVLKIKELHGIETGYLFAFLPVWKKKYK